MALTTNLTSLAGWSAYVAAQLAYAAARAADPNSAATAAAAKAQWDAFKTLRTQLKTANGGHDVLA